MLGGCPSEGLAIQPLLDEPAAASLGDSIPDTPISQPDSEMELLAKAEHLGAIFRSSLIVLPGHLLAGAALAAGAAALLSFHRFAYPAFLAPETD